MRWSRRRNRMHLAICRTIGHDWFALAYPPGPRRQRCSRCGSITEDAA